jgi:hypothetical protein
MTHSLQVSEATLQQSVLWVRMTLFNLLPATQYELVPDGSIYCHSVKCYQVIKDMIQPKGIGCGREINPSAPRCSSLITLLANRHEWMLPVDAGIVGPGLNDASSYHEYRQ